MNDLFHGYEFIPAYRDNFMVLTKRNWKYQVQKLETTLNKLKGIGLKYDIEELFFGQTRMEYYGFWVTRDGVKPIDKEFKELKYEVTNFLIRSAQFYWCSELLPLYVRKMSTYVNAFNKNNFQ